MRLPSGRVLYAAALIVTVVGVDLLLFRHHLGQRLVANIVIVVVFVAFYWKFIRIK